MSAGERASQRPAHHAEARRQLAEPARLVQRERRRVVALGVDERLRRRRGGAASAAPSRTIVRPKPSRRALGVDGEPLEVPVLTGAAGHRVGEQAVRRPRPRGTGWTAWRRSRWSARRASRRQKPSKDRWSSSSTAARSPFRARRVLRRSAGAGRPSCGEQVQPLADREPGVEERERVGRPRARSSRPPSTRARAASRRQRSTISGVGGWSAPTER